MERINVFDLYASITLDDTSYTSALQGASTQTSKFATGLKNGLATAGKLAATGLMAAGSAVIGLGAIGLNYNKQMETYTTNFEVMMGDAEAAAAKVEELKELGAKTPFELGDLADATQTLLAFNVSAEDSTEVLTQLGDISLGNVEKLESLTRAYGKMNASQKVTLEDINMMIDAGFNPLLVIAEQTGETMEQLYERISDGEVSFEEVQGAIEAATSAGGQFYQGMELASQTLEGQLSTLKDNVEALLGEVFLPISEGLVEEVLPAAVDAVNELTEAYREDGVEGMIDAAGDMIGNAIATFTESLPQFTQTAVSILESLLGGITDNLDKITAGAITTIDTLINGLIDLLPELLVTGTILLAEIAIGLLEALPDLTAKIPEIVQGIADEFVAHGPTFEQIGKDIISAIWSGIESMADWFYDNAGSFAASVASVINPLGPLLGIGKGIGGKFGGGNGHGFSGSLADGSHAGGLDFVPFDNYLANLHRGEMVLTASEASDYRANASIRRSIEALTGAVLAGGGGTYDISVNIDGETAARALFDPLRGVIAQRGEALA